jgi:hypothetical protein
MIRRDAAALHPGEATEGVVAIASVGVSFDQCSPQGGVAEGCGEAMESLECFGEGAASGVHVDEGGGEENIVDLEQPSFPGDVAVYLGALELVPEQGTGPQESSKGVAI